MCAVPCDGNRECLAVPGYDELESSGCTDSCIKSFQETVEDQQLQSPLYPEEYKNFSDCEYDITAPDGDVLQIQIDHFDIEQSSGCLYDYFTIQDGTTSPIQYVEIGGMKKLCGKLQDPMSVESQTNFAKIVFKSDAHVTGPGWSLTFKSKSESTNQRSRRAASSNDPSNKKSPSNSDAENPRSLINSDANKLNKFHNVSKYNWFSVFEKSTMPDFSDFRNFLSFKQTELSGNGHQGLDFIVQCVYDGTFCDSSDFVTVQSPTFGNCFTFNSLIHSNGDSSTKFAIPLKTTKVGTQHGLKLSFFLDKEEYIGIIGQNSGARVTLFNSKEAPPIESSGLSISAGTATILALRQETVERQSDPFTDCASEWPDFLELCDRYKQYDYNQDYCNHLCIEKSMISKCSCSDSFDSDFSCNPRIKELASNQCDAWNETQSLCTSQVYSDFTANKLKCDCPAPCRERRLHIKQSFTKWPTESYSSYFGSLMYRSTSKRVQNFVSEEMNHHLHDLEELEAHIQNNFARLEIYFEEMRFASIKETPKYNISTLFGTLGGNLGLWLGWSILSMLEFLEWMYKLCLIALIRKRNDADAEARVGK